MALGPRNTAYIETDGSLWMSGDNTFGQLGDGTTKSPTGPERIMDGVATVSFGDWHTLILKTDKTLWVTGYNGVHQIGLGMQSKTEFPVQLMSDVELIAAGGEYSIIVKSDNSLWMAGSVPSLFPGRTSNSDSFPKMTSPYAGENLASIATGTRQMFLRTNQGVLNVYGDKIGGVLGTGEGYIAISTRVPPPSNVITAALGESFGLLVTSDGTLWSTGIGTPFLPPTWEGRYVWTPSAMTNVKAIAAGSNYCLVLKTDGSLWRVGNGSDKTPNQIASDVVQIAATGNTSMYLKTDGSLWRVGGTASTGGAARINF
jgi:alpha-tubulin suppressor-like RCC1 family protein